MRILIDNLEIPAIKLNANAPEKVALRERLQKIYKLKNLRIFVTYQSPLIYLLEPGITSSNFFYDRLTFFLKGIDLI